jgi:type IV pilus assembly protein PilM
MDFDLKNILKGFSKKTEDGAVGIDIGSSSIKIVEVKKKNERAILHTYGEIALGPYGDVEIGRATRLSADRIVEALRDVINESRISTRVGALSIPMSSSMVSIFQMPKMGRNQLAEMIPIEARKYIPVPISEVSIDWFIIPKSPDAETTEAEDKFVEAMVVAIHNDVLNDFSQIVSNAELQAPFFEVEMFSTIRSVIDSTENDPVMIIDVGASATKVYISERGVIRDSHIIPKGSQKITLSTAETLGVDVNFAEKLKRNFGKNDEAQDKVLANSIDWVFDPLFGDIKNIILAFQRKHKKVVSKAILTGGGSLLNGLTDRATKKLEIQVEAGDPFSKIEAPAFLDQVLKETGGSFSVAIGLALRQLQELEG